MSNSILDQHAGANYAVYNSDCVEFAKHLPDNSIDISVYSPPFSSLYIYSESIADMGNVESDEQFIEQYSYLLRELYRATRPGRLTAIHVKDLVYYQGSSENGTAGIRAFSDMCTAAHQKAGFDFHCRVTIWRDPVLERSKTNAHGLLWKTFQADSSFCRVGMPEYLMVYRKWAKPGEEDLVKPVTHPKTDPRYSTVAPWQDLASPVWKAPLGEDIALSYGSMVWNYNDSGSGDKDMPATDVLNVKLARDPDAEKHLCPMPLNITDRALRLWSNEGDVCYSPFSGVGSEGVASLRAGRKFIGTELHPTYYRKSIENLQDAEKSSTQLNLLDLMK